MREEDATKVRTDSQVRRDPMCMCSTWTPRSQISLPPCAGFDGLQTYKVFHRLPCPTKTQRIRSISNSRTWRQQKLKKFSIGLEEFNFVDSEWKEYKHQALQMSISFQESGHHTVVRGPTCFVAKGSTSEPHPWGQNGTQKSHLLRNGSSTKLTE